MAKGRRECAPKVQDTVAAAQRAVFQEQMEGCRVADFRSQTSARDVRVEADNARRVSRRANLSKLGRGAAMGRYSGHHLASHISCTPFGSSQRGNTKFG